MINTVRELIVELQRFPADAPVLIREGGYDASPDYLSSDENEENCVIHIY